MAASNSKTPLYNRELSWLAFNERVLQEAEDEALPLFERLSFLAIFSSNLDEFFRVRVAALKSLLRLKKASRKLGFDVGALLRRIYATTADQQERFGCILREEILPKLEAEGIVLIDERGVSAGQDPFVRAHFEKHVRPYLTPRLVERGGEVPFLKDRRLYLAAELWPPDRFGFALEPPRYALIEVPSPPLDRFMWIPGEDERRYVMFIEDVIRYNLAALFPNFRTGQAYAVKLSRDADLRLEDEFSGDLMEKIEKALGRRETGIPARFLYDQQAPAGLVAFMRDLLGLGEDDLILGGRYHNLHDLADFPHFGLTRLTRQALPALPHPTLASAPSILEAMRAGDHLVHVPYQSPEPIVRFVQEAAADPAVEAIRMTLYRTAEDSAFVEALCGAAERGKEVTAFVEVKARFDEALNLQQAERLRSAGVRILYSLPGLKVHAKLALVARREGEALRRYAYLGTGNFNEKTARVYADHGLLTADARLADEADRVFAWLEAMHATVRAGGMPGDVKPPSFEHLLVAPGGMRRALYAKIDREIDHAKADRPARMTLKMNALEDPKMIRRLYRASKAGVEIDLIVRGICCLKPSAAGKGPLRVRSLVGRFLEHARVFAFHNAGGEEVYCASADWMTRNLSHRVEVAFPVYDKALRAELWTFLRLQLADNTKARLIDDEQSNAFAPAEDAEHVHAQLDAYRWLEARAATRAA